MPIQRLGRRFSGFGNEGGPDALVPAIACAKPDGAGRNCARPSLESVLLNTAATSTISSCRGAKRSARSVTISGSYLLLHGPYEILGIGVDDEAEQTEVRWSSGTVDRTWTGCPSTGLP